MRDMDQMAEQSVGRDGKLRPAGHAPFWQQCAAVAGLAGIPIGLGAAIFTPGPAAGVIFPVSLFMIWVAGMSRHGLR